MSSAGSGASTPQRSVSGDESDSDLDNEQLRPRGLTGLQNLGNTCYLNSAVQSLSHCPPLTQYFLDCAPLIRPDKSPQLSRSYLKLMMELWHKKRQSYVVPSGVVSGIKAVHPMFRGYTQQDAQEFLRCLMDQLHEELKVAAEEGSCDDSDDSEGEGPTVGEDTNNANSAGDQGEGAEMNTVIEVPRRPSIGSMSSQSELDYETCDSGLSSEQGYPGERDEDSDGDGNGDVRQHAAQLKALKSYLDAEVKHLENIKHMEGEPNQQELFEQLGATFDPSMAGGPQGMMGGVGGMDAMGGMFQNMVRHLLSKELLYEPLKEVSEKYTVYIAKEAATLSAEDIERYKSQQGIVDQVVTHLDGDSADLSEEEKSARFEVLLDLLQKSFPQMHELGQPPTEVVGEGQSVMPDFSSVMGMGQAPMAVIKMSGMSEDMQQDAVDCATQALEKYNCEEPADIAARNSTKSTTPPGK